MTREKWQNIVGNIKDNFEFLDQGEEHLDDEGGVDIEFIVFHGPIGKIRLEYIVKPVVTDKKTNYSLRIGSETVVNYVYSATEKSETMNAYKYDDDINDWVEFDSKMFA